MWASGLLTLRSPLKWWDLVDGKLREGGRETEISWRWIDITGLGRARTQQAWHVFFWWQSRRRKAPAGDFDGKPQKVKTFVNLTSTLPWAADRQCGSAVLCGLLRNFHPLEVNYRALPPHAYHGVHPKGLKKWDRGPGWIFIEVFYLWWEIAQNGRPMSFWVKGVSLESNCTCTRVKSTPSVKGLLFKHEDLNLIPQTQG